MKYLVALGWNEGPSNTQSLKLFSLVSETVHKAAFQGRHRLPWRVIRESWPGILALKQFRAINKIAASLSLQGRHAEAYEFLTAVTAKEDPGVSHWWGNLYLAKR